MKRNKKIILPSNKGILLCLLLLCSQITFSQRIEDPRETLPAKPNIILILTDDQGYEDIGVYGARGFQTPNLDRLAKEGMRFTSFYSASSICTPSRAALLTGRYPTRVGLPDVLFPDSKIGLNPAEVTLAEMLKENGYATSALGKWHLGAHPVFLPTNHGFDRFFGLPYSSDMSPLPAHNPRENRRLRFPPLPLVENTTIIEREPDQSTLIARYTKRALEFIEKNKQSPFFLYLAHQLPHVPLYASEKFKGLTERGIYGDVIQEIDWSVGEIIQSLVKNGLRENTLIFFTSDNGPWLIFGDHGGSAGILREGKITTFEGGQRVPAIASWPGKIPPGTISHALVTAMDLLPTMVILAGGNLPEDRIVDGYDIWPVLCGQKEESSYDTFFYYLNRRLQAVRKGPWKLHVPHSYLSVGKAGHDGDVGTSIKKSEVLSLYNLESDPGEMHNLANKYPEIVDQLMKLIEDMRTELGDAHTGVTGSHEGKPGEVEETWAEIGDAGN